MRAIFQHHESDQTCFSSYFKVAGSPFFSNLTIRSGDSLSNNRRAENKSFFLGTFKKYSAMLNENEFILKMGQSEAPELPAVEYLCNEIGAELEIPVAEFFIINFGFGNYNYEKKNSIIL